MVDVHGEPSVGFAIVISLRVHIGVVSRVAVGRRARRVICRNARYDVRRRLASGSRPAYGVVNREERLVKPLRVERAVRLIDIAEQGVDQP